MAVLAVVLGLVAVLGMGFAFRDRVFREWYYWSGAKDSEGVPRWLRYHKFDQEDFTFVRIKYGSSTSTARWATDYPDADLNLSARLREVFSLEVSDAPAVMGLTDPGLSGYPFIYISEPGSLVFSGEEVSALRQYLLGGGFLMVDDFWGEREWKSFHSEIKRVFPDREPVELPLEHAVFHCVFELEEKPQVPSITHVLMGDPVTRKRFDPEAAHYKGILDDDGRVMVILCHNTDLADGWERTTESEYYYREFSQKKAFPMGVNIVFYALTH